MLLCVIWDEESWTKEHVFILKKIYIYNLSRWLQFFWNRHFWQLVKSTKGQFKCLYHSTSLNGFNKTNLGWKKNSRSTREQPKENHPKPKQDFYLKLSVIGIIASKYSRILTLHVVTESGASWRVQARTAALWSCQSWRLHASLRPASVTRH